jgi:response regulator RpfG family c-di-GMP phosphodiesterase
MLDGGGYPNFTYPRACHFVSRLVHVCDVYDALHTDRPYRDAWPQPKIVDYLRERSGGEFDRQLADAFVMMIHEWEPKEIDDWRPGQRADESAEQVQGELSSPHGERLERAVLGSDE